MKAITGLVLVVFLGASGCVNYTATQMTDVYGNPIGLTLHQFRQSGDLASWQYGSAVTDGNTLKSFATNVGGGIIDPALKAAGAVGAGYFIGSGLKNAEGDNTEIDNVNGQFQEQNLNGTNNRFGK